MKVHIYLAENSALFLSCLRLCQPAGSVPLFSLPGFSSSEHSIEHHASVLY